MESVGERIRESAARDEAAAEAEPDTDDETEAEEEEGPPSPEPEPPAEPQPGGVLTAEQGAELEKATTAYIRRVAKVFPAESMPPECPTCGGLGFDLTGSVGGPSYRSTDQFKRCEVCDGLGKLLTDSQVEGHLLRDCSVCQGRGYLEKIAPPAAVPEQVTEYGTPKWMGDVPAPAPPVAPMPPPGV